MAENEVMTSGIEWDNSSGINGSLASQNVTIILQGSLHYSVFEIISLAIVMTAMIIVIVIGNMLVVIAISTENNLTSVQNWFIASLAVADMLIGLLIMPFSLAYELMAYWMFGELWCEIHGALDVFLCTASILNLCVISLDRYWSITNSVAYLNQRTPTKVFIMIITVWTLSGLISIPPLLGWKAEGGRSSFEDSLLEMANSSANIEVFDDETKLTSIGNYTDALESIVYPQCGLSKDIGYVLYSAFGSFYIPSCIMVFVYIKIYFAARERARRVVKKLHFSKRISRRLGMSKGGPNPNIALAKANGANDASNKAGKHNGRVVEQDLVTTISAAVQEPTTVVQPTRNRVRIQEPNEITQVGYETMSKQSNHTNPAPSKTKQFFKFKIPRSSSNLSDGRRCHFFHAKKENANGQAVSIEEPDFMSPSATEVVHFEPAQTNTPHAFGACVLKESCTRRSVGVSTRSENDPKLSERHKSVQTRRHILFYPCKNRKLFQKNKAAGSAEPRKGGRKTSKEARDQIDLGSTSYVTNKKVKSVESKQAKKQQKIATLVTAGQQSNKSTVDAEKEKKRIARKKERRATLILGLIMGSFIACWFPFFFLYSISPVCPICEEDPNAACCVKGWGFSFAFWLGYSNSALNPVIYTIFNKDFRQAFKRILFR